MASSLRVAGAAALAVLVVLAYALGPPSASAAYPGDNGLLVFQRGGDLYTVTPSGTALRRLTTVGDAALPRWSPDGQKIAFSRRGSVWVMAADGSGMRRVAHGWGASWSPDGRRLAFLAEDGPWFDHLQVVTLADPARTVRTIHVGEYLFGEASWSPDGRGIVTPESGGGGGSSWISALTEVAPDGQSARWILETDCGGEGDCEYGIAGFNQASYSPDARRLAFTARPAYTYPPGPPHVYQVNRDGTGLQQLTFGPGEHRPTWSPDGTQLAFVERAADGRWSVRVQVARPGAPARTVVSGATQVDWQPLP